MTEGNGPPQTRVFTLVESLDEQWIKLPLPIMQQCGPAVQTVGGLLKITSRETFVTVDVIAEQARLPVATVRKHLKILHDAGWIQNLGRQRTRAGILRRTATIKLRSDCCQLPYGALPWWACGTPKLKWSSQALFSVLMSQLMGLKAASDRNSLSGCLELEDYLVDCSMAAQFRWGIPRLMEYTGLSRPSCVSAKRELQKHGIIFVECDDWQSPHSITLNTDLSVTIKPHSPGRVTIHLRDSRMLSPSQNLVNT